MKINYKIALPFFAVTAALLFTSGCCGKYKDEITGLKDEMNRLKGEMARSASDYEAQLGELTEYQKALETQLEKLGVDRKKLMADYKNAQSDLEAKQKLIAEIMKKEEQARQRLAMLNSMLGKFKKMIETGKLKVKVKNNKMVLELPSAVLFDSGKADLKEDGQATLLEVAQVLATIKDREFQVAGHTDNEPLTSRRRKFDSNWELSTARAVAVVKYMQENGVSPTSLSAAGYSEYQPSVSNDTEENKAMNRRIEITLMPNINELPDLSALEKAL